MRARTRNPFLSVRTEGSILPADVLARIAAADKDLDGLTPESYHLAKNERINEVATRAWNRLQGAWEAFREASEKLPESDLGTTLTRERWLLILFQELGYGRLKTHRAWELDSRSYPISHLWDSTPIHLVGCRVKMDTKQAGVAGAARVSPHSLVQEFLNRSDDHLWGIVSNGLILRLLRDNVSLTRQAYVEFDLEAMMEGEGFSDFVLLFLVCHQSRVEVPEEKTPESCWLEQWHNAAAEQGIRALDELRNGVKSALDTFGAGFLAHPANTKLRQKLKEGTFSTQDYYRQLLRVVYRLLFLFVAEDRDLLYDPNADLENRAIYAKYYATRRIRELAQQRRGTKHADLYRGLRLVFEKLREGCPELALPALGSFLFSDESTPDLDTADIANRDLLLAFRQLACTIEGDALRPIDYRNLGPEELGSVYESLLEMHPQINTDAAKFKLEVVAGNERKGTGSFYTHSSLVQCLLDSALDPVLDEAVVKPDPEAALLDLKICDPASGSGHFLIAAALRVAKRLAAVRTGEDEPSPDATRSALRDVIGRCIYGVDINPMAVELCKISLWMEAMEPGKTLGFLDHHIKCGNSLLGTTPALMADGIPNDAFKPIKGDDKTVCKDLKALNKKERAGQIALGEMLDRRSLPDLAKSFRSLANEDDASPAARNRKAEHYRSLVQSAEYENAWFLADAWCAAFVLPKTSLEDLAVTHRRFRTWEADSEHISSEDRKTVRQIADECQFFHWHLAFPEVFRIPPDDEKPENEQCGWSGGFDCVISNPPYLFLSGRSSPVKALQRKGEAAQAEQMMRRHSMDAFLFASTSKGCQDYFKWFANLATWIRGHSWSRVGLILPTPWLSLPRYADVRSVLVANGLSVVLDFGFGAFPDQTVATCAMTCGTRDCHFDYLNLRDGMRPELSSESIWALALENRSRIEVVGDGFSFYQHAPASSLFDSASDTLADLCSISEGDHHIDVRSPTWTSHDGGLCLLIVSDSELGRFRTPRTREIAANGNESFSEALHSGPRVILRKTGDQLVSAVAPSEELAVTHQNAYVIHPHAGISVHLLQGLLGSRMLSYLYRASPLGQKGRVMAQLRIGGLYALPVPPVEVLQASSSRIERLSTELHADQSSAKWDELNALVYSLYEVDDALQEEIDDWCSDILIE